jgi:methionine synthase II (cobalamin-independent)
MATKVTETILPTTMIGSYPKPRWYQQYNLAGEDLLEWWKLEQNWHAYWDATTACIKDQELAGLDGPPARRGPRPDLQRRPQGPRRARRRVHPDRGPRRLDARARRQQRGPGRRRRHPQPLHRVRRQIVERIHRVLEHIEPECVYLLTDCGLKALPRFCAFEKPKALSRAAARVRAEIGVKTPVVA